MAVAKMSIIIYLEKLKQDEDVSLSDDCVNIVGNKVIAKIVYDYLCIPMGP